MDWRVVAAFFALVAFAYAARAIANTGVVPLINDTDDAMRLVEVRDFLAGQGWYDLVQHRLNTPFGASIHWSRLVDLPIAGLLLVLRPVFGATADTIAAYVLPLLLLGGLMVVSARIALRLAGPEGLLPGLALPAFSLITMTEFAPGRFDHHGPQIILALLMLDQLLAALERPRRAVFAGIAAALALAIGAESLPAVVAGIAAAGLLWVCDTRQSALMGWFGVGVGVATPLLLAALVSPSSWFVPYCDALSPVFALAAAAVGAALVVLAQLKLRRWPLRLAAGLLTGGVLIVALYLIYPKCFAAPYADLGPWLLSHWIDRIDEAKPLWVSIRSDAPYVIAVGLPVALALLVASRGVAGPDWRKWLVYLAVLAVATLVMLAQIRGARLATSLAAPAGAAAIAWARARWLAGRRLKWLAALLGAWVGFAGLIVGLSVSAVDLAMSDGSPSAGQVQTGRAGCRLPEAFAPLKAGPPQRIMAPIDLGPHLLLFTSHAVVGAPYHRNVAGVSDTFAFFNGPIDAARDILARRQIGLVVLCPSMPEVAGLDDAAPNSFARLRAQNMLPDWLVPTSPPGAVLETYAVHLP
jgi:hypothetical protein